jgi:hypothetical protein
MTLTVYFSCTVRRLSKTCGAKAGIYSRLMFCALFLPDFRVNRDCKAFKIEKSRFWRTNKTVTVL